MTDRSRTTRFLCRHFSRRSSNDRGVIAVLFALLVGVLILPVCAFCLDLANLRLSADQLQQQVRSAAVTGVLEYQSGASLTATQQSVAKVLTANDITANVSCPPTCAAPSGGSNPCKAIKVTITQGIPTIFAQIFGVRQINFTRTSTAIYHKSTTNNDDDDDDGDGRDDDGRDDDDDGRDDDDDEGTFCSPSTGTSANYATDTVETID
jgi:Flp pilus assembly protein TadG